MAARRAYITILFCDIVGSTQLLSELEPETLHALYEQLRKIAMTIAARNSGEVIRFDGDGMLIIWGRQKAIENGGFLASETALELHKAASDLKLGQSEQGLSVQLHSGVHSGVVLVSDGDELRGKVEVIGDATHSARRLCDLASPGAVLATDVALGEHRHFFDTSTVQQISLRGHARRLGVCEVKGKITSANRLTASRHERQMPFIGRKEDLARLLIWVSSTSPSTPRICMVMSGAGMGKSRLLREFLDRASVTGVNSHLATAVTYRGRQANFALREIVRSLLRSEFALSSFSKRDLSHLETQLPQLSISTLENLLSGASSLQRNEIRDALLPILALAVKDTHVVLAIDDWQWVDDATRNMVMDIADFGIDGLKILVASREPDLDIERREDSVALTLSGLTDAEVAQAISTLLPAHSPYEKNKIAKGSGGSPLYIEELCYAVEQNSSLLEGLSGPLSLEPLILYRFDQLTASQQSLLRRASVAGFIVADNLFESLTGVKVHGLEVTELMAADFLARGEEQNTLRFKHALVRDAIYKTLSPDERRSTHKEIAEYWGDVDKELGFDDHNPDIGYHLFNGAEFSAAITPSMLAGQKALAASQLDIAQYNFKIVLQCVERLELNKAHEKLYYSGLTKYGVSSVIDPAEEHLSVFDAAKRYADRATSPRIEVLSEYWRGFIYYGLGLPNKAIQCLTSARTTSLQNDVNFETAHITSKLAAAHYAAGKYQIAEDLFEEALKFENSSSHSNRHKGSLAYLLTCRAYMFADIGKFTLSDEIFAQAERSTSDAAEYALLAINGRRASSEYWRGDYKQSIEYGEFVAQAAQKMRSRYHSYMSRGIALASKYELTKDADILNELVKSTKWMERLKLHQYISLNYGYLTRIFSERGNIEQTRHFAAKALGRARKGDRLGETMAYRGLALLYSNLGQADRFGQYLKCAEHSAFARGSQREAEENSRLAERLVS